LINSKTRLIFITVHSWKRYSKEREKLNVQEVNFSQANEATVNPLLKLNLDVWAIAQSRGVGHRSLVTLERILTTLIFFIRTNL